MNEQLQKLLDQLYNLNKEILKQCLKDYDCFLYNNNYPKTLGLEELWELLHSENKDDNSIYLIKKNYHIPIKLYCDEIKTETIKDDVIFKYTTPYFRESYKINILGMA